ncbi:MAG TPA: TonB-dependent receptor [Lentimicrobium sp.]|nr:TonB-dependent receptor [Lentimicrobium sp.]
MKKFYGILVLIMMTCQIVFSQEIDTVNLSTVIITATRNERNLFEVPQRVDVISCNSIENMPSLAADNLLLMVPGLNISRGASIFGSANISMRGMGNEAGRVLVMVDGIPINKGDGGTVNWNAVNVSDISKIEVLKGPGSTVHGGNAMGGVINLISPLPTKPLQGNVSQSIGTFSTLQTTVGLQGLNKKLYWAVNGGFRTSDGYVTTPVDEQNEYTIPAFLYEYNAGARAGYLINNMSKLEIAGNYYSGKRGTGTDFTGFNFKNDELAANNGAYNLFEVINAHLSYANTFKNNSSLKLNFYTQRENYINIKESLKDTIITRYDVLSIRDDYGFLSNYTISPFKGNTLSLGIDLRYNAVDAADKYVTSSDKVINKGKMGLYGIYLQDELKFRETPFSLLGGIRFDYAIFNDGVFKVENPTRETAFLSDFSSNLDNTVFSAISPRLSVQYYRPEKFRVYIGYSKGYRPPLLDDMCRTGRISGGMKIANPNLKPEYLDNLELGTDLFLTKKMEFSASVFYSVGTDYHAYISTGDSIVLNKKLRPIIIKSNIGKVGLYGAELSFKLKAVKNLECLFSYSYTFTDIIDYKSATDAEDLSGKELVYQPKDLLNLTATWKNKVVNVTTVFSYKGAQWMNDINTEELESYYMIDLQLWRPVYYGMYASLMVQNLLDNHYIDSRNTIAPGRLIFLKLGYNFGM